MFRFFNVPRVSYNYYRPTIYRQRYVPIEAYLLNSIKQAQEYEKFKSLIYQEMLKQRKGKEIHDENEQPIDNIDNIDEKKEEPKNENTQEIKAKQFYYFEKHSKFDGEKIVEEQKERKIDSEGKIHQTLKRSLGDQWYQTEQIKDEEGKTTVKESWHNVSENEIENFKQKWINQIGNQNELEQDNKIENAEINKNEEESAEKAELDNQTETEIECKDEKVNDEKDESKNDNEEKNQIEQKISNETEVN